MARLTKQQKWVCGVVLSLGIVSAVLGLFAEMSRTKVSDISVTHQNSDYGFEECHYPSNVAPFVLGGLAALVLLVAQALVTIVGGCICCRSMPPVPPNSPASSNRSVAIICFVACWITFLNAFALLMAGAGASVYTLKQQTVWTDGQCPVVKPLVFAGGSLLALATVVLDLIFYMASCAATAAAKAAAATPQVSPSQISLGQPYPCHRPPSGNTQTHSYPFGQFPHPPHNQMHANTYPNVVTGYVPAHPLLVYPNVVTGYPKPSAPTNEI